MTLREKLGKIAKCEKVNGTPNIEICPWPQTVDRWKREGLPVDIPESYWLQGVPFFNIDPLYTWIELDLAPLPRFEEEVFEETDRYIIKRNSLGITEKALKDGTVRGTRMSMNQYLDFPVKDRESYLRYKERLNPYSLGRYPSNLEKGLFKNWQSNSAMCATTFGTEHTGFYMFLRQCMGTVNLSYAFYDQPDLIHEMLDFRVDFLISVLKKVLDFIKADFYYFSEDFAGKGGPLISPKIFDDFFAPRYRKLISYLHNKGINIMVFDSDGDIRVLIPRLIDCGINIIEPVEIAAGMDPVQIKKEYGNSIAMLGGIDKREIALGKEHIKKELDTKLPYLLDKGGYLPCIDHSIPPDISLEDFFYYMELKIQYLSH